MLKKIKEARFGLYCNGESRTKTTELPGCIAVALVLTGGRALPKTVAHFQNIILTSHSLWRPIKKVK